MGLSCWQVILEIPGRASSSPPFSFSSWAQVNHLLWVHISRAAQAGTELHRGLCMCTPSSSGCFHIVGLAPSCKRFARPSWKHSSHVILVAYTSRHFLTKCKGQLLFQEREKCWLLGPWHWEGKIKRCNKGRTWHPSCELSPHVTEGCLQSHPQSVTMASSGQASLSRLRVLPMRNRYYFIYCLQLWFCCEVEPISQGPTLLYFMTLLEHIWSAR